MKRWLPVLLLLVSLVTLAMTMRLWLPWLVQQKPEFLQFLDDQGGRIQSAANLIQITL